MGGAGTAAVEGAARAAMAVPEPRGRRATALAAMGGAGTAAVDGAEMAAMAVRERRGGAGRREPSRI